MKKKPELNEMSLDDINDGYCVIRNIECDYVLGLMTNEEVKEVFEDVEDPFPLSADSIIDFEVLELIEEGVLVSKEKVRKNIYENIDFDKLLKSDGNE